MATFNDLRLDANSFSQQLINFNDVVLDTSTNDLMDIFKGVLGAADEHEKYNVITNMRTLIELKSEKNNESLLFSKAMSYLGNKKSERLEIQEAKNDLDNLSNNKPTRQFAKSVEDYRSQNKDNKALVDGMKKFFGSDFDSFLAKLEKNGKSFEKVVENGKDKIDEAIRLMNTSAPVMKFQLENLLTKPKEESKELSPKFSKEVEEFASRSLYNFELVEALKHEYKDQYYNLLLNIEKSGKSFEEAINKNIKMTLYLLASHTSLNRGGANKLLESLLTQKNPYLRGIESKQNYQEFNPKLPTPKTESSGVLSNLSNKELFKEITHLFGNDSINSLRSELEKTGKSLDEAINDNKEELIKTLKETSLNTRDLRFAITNILTKK